MDTRSCKGAIGISLGAGCILDDRIEERQEVKFLPSSIFLKVSSRDTCLTGCIYDRELKLVIICTELDEEIEYHINYLIGTSVGTVDLVDTYDRLKTHLKSLTKNESRLGHGTVESIYYEENRIYHLEYSLNLTAEVSVSRSINDVDPDALIINGRILGKDRDASLSLEIIAVHDLLYDLLILSIDTCLLEHGIYDSSLTVVNVCDDGDVAHILDLCHTTTPFPFIGIQI